MKLEATSDSFEQKEETIKDSIIHKNEKIFCYKFSRRALDIITASIGILLSFPIIVVFAAIISLETPGNPIFIQERVGLNGNIFYIYKLRSMFVNAEENGAKWAEKNDIRVTKVGRFIRKTRIDELPQLFNVLKGDMSLIGPRPERYIFTEQFEKEMPGFKNRLQVRPGLTGWAQVNGGYEITPKEKLALDLQYIERQSFKIDVLILLKTIKICLTGNGAR